MAESWTLPDVVMMSHMQLQWLGTAPADSCLETSTTGLSRTPGVMTGAKMDITRSLLSAIRPEFARVRPISSSPQCLQTHNVVEHLVHVHSLLLMMRSTLIFGHDLT